MATSRFTSSLSCKINGDFTLDSSTTRRLRESFNLLQLKMTNRKRYGPISSSNNSMDFSAEGEISPFGSESPIFVPRICNLKEFSEDKSPSSVISIPNPSEHMSVTGLLVANVEAKIQASNFETLSGRLAMMGLVSALSVEFVTGNSIFSGIDLVGLAEIIGLCFFASITAAGFALAWRAKRHVSNILAHGCIELVDSAVDSVVEGLFFETRTTVPWINEDE